VSEIAKRMMTVVCILFLLLIAASIVYYRSTAFLPFALGCLLGTALNVVKIILLDRTVGKMVHMAKEDAANYARLQHFVRYLLTGLIFLASALISFISIWGTAAGIFTFQIAMYLTKYTLKADAGS